MFPKIYKYLLFFIFICMASCTFIQTNNEEHKLKMQKLENENKRIKEKQKLIAQKNKKLDSRNKRLVTAGKELLNELNELLKKYEDLNSKNVILTKQNFELYKELFQKQIGKQYNQKDPKKLEKVKEVFDSYPDLNDTSPKKNNFQKLKKLQESKKNSNSKQEKFKTAIMKRISQKRKQLIDNNSWTHKDELKYFNLKTAFEGKQDLKKTLKQAKNFEIEINEHLKNL